MRAWALVLVFVAALATACAGKHPEIANPASLRMLDHVPAGQSWFGVILDASSGRALAAFRVDNPIRTAIPDGDGGWYIGGGFIRVDGRQRKRLAHIRTDGSLDPDWRPEANGNGVSVTSLARIGSRIYVAGDFARLDRAPRLHLGAVDSRRGGLDRNWHASASASGWNLVLLPAGRRLIVGGGSCCSEAASSVGALDAKTGAIDKSWRPRVDSARLEGGGVYLLAANGPGILVGGVFRSVNGIRRSAVAEIDSESGALVRKWSPRLAGRSCPWCALFAAAVGRKRVYASVNGPARYQLIAFDRRTGRIDTEWHANVRSTTGFYGAASATAVAAVPSRVYVAGDFDEVEGHRRPGLAALDAVTARVLPSWAPKANTVSASLLASSGSRLLLGVGLSRQVQFAFTGLKTFVPVRRLRVVLALSGAGSVRIGVGRKCDYERWTETARCDGRVFRWVGSVRFPKAGRRRYVRDLGLQPGRYFVRFVASAPGGPPQTPSDFPITVP
jgi:Domain of unknown function (DUF5122) beta-propeller